MLYKQTHCTCHHYAILPNTLYMTPLRHSTKHTLFVTIILYQQTHSSHHNYAITRNELYISQLCYTTKHTVHFTIMVNELTHTSCLIMLYKQKNVHVKIIPYHQTHFTCHHNDITRNTFYTSPLCYTLNQNVQILITLYQKHTLISPLCYTTKHTVQGNTMLYN